MIQSSKTVNFISRSLLIHNNKYSYDNTIFLNSNDKVIITCPIHGDFKQSPNNHLKGKGCPHCGRISSGLKKRKKSIASIKTNKRSSEETICILSSMYPNYDFSKSDFRVVRDYITVSCSSHGDFTTRVNNILYGRGCPKCGIENQGFNRTAFVNKCNGGNGTLYVLKCFSEDEVFYKVGITSRTIKQRYSSKRDMPYQYDVLYELSSEPSYIWDLELTYKRELSNLRYSPKQSFDGCLTECFNSPPRFPVKD